MMKTAVALPDHKIVAEEVTPELLLVAQDYARLYCGNFSFMLSMQDAVIKWNKLSAKQAAGVVNCMRAQVAFEQKKAAEIAATSPVIDEETGVVLKAAPTIKMLPFGTYTVAFAEGERVTVRIKKLSPDELADDFYSKNNVQAGSLKIQVLTGPDNTSSYTTIGLQKHNGIRWMYKKAQGFQTALKALDALTDPETAKAAGFEYAVKSSKCFRCNKKLTVPASIHMGMGPDCASKASF